MYALKSGKPAPELVVDTLCTKGWRLSEQKPGLFTMIVFYRGYFCESCQHYISSLHRHLNEFRKREVDSIAVSMDARDHAQTAYTQWKLDGLEIGYGLTASEARNWHLFISGQGNPLRHEALFNEPGLFLIRPDQTIYAVFLQSNEFARPNFDQIIAAIDFVSG